MLTLNYVFLPKSFENPARSSSKCFFACVENVFVLGIYKISCILQILVYKSLAFAVSNGFSKSQNFCFKVSASQFFFFNLSTIGNCYIYMCVCVYINGDKREDLRLDIYIYIRWSTIQHMIIYLRDESRRILCGITNKDRMKERYAWNTKI